MIKPTKSEPLIPKVLAYWQAVEALTPQDAWRVNPSDLANPVYGIKRERGALMPWADAAHTSKPLDAGMSWVYDAQCGVHDTHDVSKLTVEALSRMPDEDEGDQSVSGRLFDLRFDAAGLPIAQSFSLSLSAWASGYLLREHSSVAALLEGGWFEHEGLPEPGGEIANPRSGFAGFDALSKALGQWVADQAELLKTAGGTADAMWLASLVDLVVANVNLPEHLFSRGAFARIRGSRRRNDSAQDRNEVSEGLNSFYAADLRSLHNASLQGDIGEGLKRFLGGPNALKEGQRIDVRESSNNDLLAEMLAPDRMPAGRWPADHSLAFSQQLAVNSIFTDLRDGPGLFSVNGPPGTGKTTLLRDLVAQVVTERAAQLVKLGAKAFNGKTLMKVGDAVAPYYPLHKSLIGYSIVVSTNGNGAAENVTLELPARSAVPARVANVSNYFPEIAESVTGKKAWGLLAAPLGNRRNRTEFVSRFWWGQRKSNAEASTPGMRNHLRAIADSDKSPALSWNEAVQRYKKAVNLESGCRKRVQDAAALPSKVASIVSGIKKAEVDLAVAQRKCRETGDMLIETTLRAEKISNQAQLAKSQRDKALDAVAMQEADKPGLWSVLASMGKSKQAWQDKLAHLQVSVDVASQWQGNLEEEAAQLQSAILEGNLALSRINLDVSERTARLADARIGLAKSEEMLDEAADRLGSSWLDMDVDHEERERISPWGDPAWLAAREEVFLAALDVHRAFTESNAAQMGANLALACDWLSGKRIQPELIPLAIDSLCMVVPVISATFASFPRMFANVQKESIGWLLVDEGGQAQAAHAACAIWRAARTVMVGDPLQLKPVVTVPAGVESELARHFKVDSPWMPSWNSAQGLADMSSRMGTWLGALQSDRLWIGCPLRLHRRCAPEMFRISNEVAYSGMMVYGTNYKNNVSWPASAWLDVKATANEGHWIEAEGHRLQSLLQLLLEQGAQQDQIAMITPFRDCSLRLKRIARANDIDMGKVGTVHTAQGKEADIVIIVLGGNPRSAGAKSWAASEPNLLNVAVSRGKKRLYVIGDVDLWKPHSYFSVMAEQLPIAQAVAA